MAIDQPSPKEWADTLFTTLEAHRQRLAAVLKNLDSQIQQELQEYGSVSHENLPLVGKDKVKSDIAKEEVGSRNRDTITIGHAVNMKKGWLLRATKFHIVVNLYVTYPARPADIKKGTNAIKISGGELRYTHQGYAISESRMRLLQQIKGTVEAEFKITLAME